MEQIDRTKLGESVRKLLLSVLCLNLSFSPTLFALEVKITESRNLRDAANDNGGELTVVGRLTAGSVVDIPDEYAVVENGKLSFDKSVQKWLLAIKDKAAKTPVLAKFDGKKQDYFIPIKVVQVAAGSRYNTSDQNLMISIRDVGVVKDESSQKVEMQITRDTNVISKKVTKTSLEAKCNGNCDKPVTDKISSLAIDTAKIADVSFRSPKAEFHSNDPAVKKFLEMSANFRKTCNMELSDFVKVIEEKLKTKPLKVEQELAIMGQESNGQCFPISATGLVMKHGLFGIQDPGIKNTCSAAQGHAIKSIVASGEHVFERLSNYENDSTVNCVGNPFLNLEASLQIVDQKANYLKALKVDREGKYTKESYQKILFNYNGNVKLAKNGYESYRTQYVKIVAPLSDLLAKAIAGNNTLAAND